MMFKIILVTALIALASAATHSHRRAPRLDGRIVGGAPAKIEDHNHQVSMQYYGRHMCGGSIISNKYIVTAAHCTSGQSASSLTIRAGSSLEASGGQVVAVKEIHQHPKYDSWTIDYDISILELEKEMPLNPAVGIIRLPAEGDEVVGGTSAVCTGWGALSEGGGSPKELQAVTVKIVDKAECEKQYEGYTVTDRMVCAGVNGGGKDACQGDSGGPLVANNVLAGVVSWGRGCARPDYPGIYSSVAILRGHIKDVTGL